MSKLKELVQALSGYLARNPKTLVEVARHAVQLRVAIPMDLLRWVAARFHGGARVKAITLEARPPAIRVGTTTALMGAEICAGATLTVEELALNGEELRLHLRVQDLSLEVPENPNHPIVVMVSSGALDLSKPANLLSFLPNKPGAVVSAEGDRFVLDLLKIPRLRDDTRLRKLLNTLAPVLELRSISTDEDMLVLRFGLHPRGVLEALQAAKGS